MPSPLHARRAWSTPRACTLLAVAASLFAARAVAAQGVTASLDAGVAGVRYADTATFDAATIAPMVRFATRTATVTAAGSYSQGTGSRWSAQGGIDASLFTAAVGPLRPELVASAGGTTADGGGGTGQGTGELRLHLMRRAWGVWAGGGGGRAWDGVEAHALVLGDAGAWARVGAATLVASVTPQHVSGTGTFTDGQIALHVARGRGALDAAIGARAGASPILGASGRRAWGGASATFWLARHLALVAGAGSYPVDFAQGFPGGRYATFALRIAARRGRGADDARARPPTPTAPERTVDAFEVRDAGAPARTIRVRADDASRVEIAGDFTDWRPVALARDADGWWTATLPIASGTHQVNLRLDGTAWVVPPGLVPMADEFAGSVGLLTVP